MQLDDKWLFADIEANGLYHGVTKVHCCSFVNDQYEQVAVGLDDIKSRIEMFLGVGYNFVFHNSLYDVSVLRKFGVDIPEGRYACSMVASHKINPQRRRYSLASFVEEDGLAKIDYGQAMIDHGLWDGEGSVYEVEYNPVMHEYVLQDSRVGWARWKKCLLHFQHDSRLAKSYFEIHLPFIESVMEMQTKGMYLDPQKVVTLYHQLSEETERLTTEFQAKYPVVKKLTWDKTRGEYKLTGKVGKPNVRSSNDVVSLLLERGCPIVETNFETGRPKTSQAVLNYLAATIDPTNQKELHELVEILRQTKSVVGIYTQLVGLLENLAEGGYIYANWKQAETVTHRLACSQPNLMNISTRNKTWGPRMRAMFTAPPGYSMIVGDLAQIELCILAAYLEILNQDSTMAEAAREARDFHDANTEAWFGVDKEHSDPKEFKTKRAITKNGIFASNYGAKAMRLALTLGIPVTEALEILNTVDEKTTIAQLKRKVWATARLERDVQPVKYGSGASSSGFLYDVLGTRMYYPDINSRNKSKRASAERQVFNALMQTGCFSIMAHLLNQTRPKIKPMGAYLSAFIHDEAHIMAPTQVAEEVCFIANEVFNSFVIPTPKGVPVRADFSIVNDWSEK